MKSIVLINNPILIYFFHLIWMYSTNHCLYVIKIKCHKLRRFGNQGNYSNTQSIATLHWTNHKGCTSIVWTDGDITPSTVSIVIVLLLSLKNIKTQRPNYFRYHLWHCSWLYCRILQQSRPSLIKSPIFNTYRMPYAHKIIKHHLPCFILIKWIVSLRSWLF